MQTMDQARLSALAPRLPIGELSRRTGCNVETIRYYERAGILPRPARSEGGHRMYGTAHVMRLGFVRRARELGFTLDEVRALLRLIDQEDYACAEARDIAARHLEAVRARLADLQRMEQALSGLIACCDDGAPPYCPLLEALFDGRSRGGSAP